MKKKMKKNLLLSLTVTAVLFSLSPSLIAEPSVIDAQTNVSQKYQNELPLGTPSLTETRSVQQIAPGVSYTFIKRGFKSASDYHTVNAGFFAKESDAKKLKQKLKDNGFGSMILKINNASYNDINKEVLGYLVRTGKFTSQEKATAYRKQLSKKGFTNFKATYSGYDGTKTTGPWSIHVLEMDPDRLNITTTLAMNQVEGRETVTSMATRINSLASINGGYFIGDDNDGTPGDLAGVSALRGELVGEAIKNRSGLILSGNRPTISTVSTSLNIQSFDKLTIYTYLCFQ